MFKLAQNIVNKMDQGLKAFENLNKKSNNLDTGNTFINKLMTNSSVKENMNKLPKAGQSLAIPKMTYAFDSEAFPGVKIFKAPWAGAKSGFVHGNEQALRKLLETNSEYYQRTGKNLSFAWNDNVSGYRTIKDHMSIPSKYRAGTGPRNSHGYGDAFDIRQLNNQDKSWYDPIAAEIVKKHKWYNVGAWDPTHIAFSRSW